MKSSKSFLIIMGVCVGLLLMSACSLTGAGSTPTNTAPSSTPEPPTPTPVPAAAVVNGEIIPLVEYQASLAQLEAAQKELGFSDSIDTLKQRAADDLVNQTLLAQAAVSAGHTLDDDALQARLDELSKQMPEGTTLADWMTAQGYDEGSLHTALRRAMLAAWQRDQIEAAVPQTAEQVHARQILVYKEETAQRLYNDIQSGADFATVASEVDPISGGDLGWFPKGYLLQADVEKAAFSLEAGRISEIIKTPIGYHIIEVIERDPQRQLSPDARLTLQEAALNQWIEQRRTESQISLSLP
jgi:parvulin-like peptidyl-prolyl isomerase